MQTNQEKSLKWPGPVCFEREEAEQVMHALSFFYHAVTWSYGKMVPVPPYADNYLVRGDRRVDKWTREAMLCASFDQLKMLILKLEDENQENADATYEWIMSWLAQCKEPKNANG